MLTVIVLFVIDPKSNMDACLTGLRIWTTSLLPALFPFFVLTRLLSTFRTVEVFSRKISPITKFLFATPGISAYVYIMSIMSGYPVGAKITADLYEQGSITKKQAWKITTFTSTSGPLFVIGTVGVGMFFNMKLGILVLIAHFIGALLNGILFRGYGKKEPDTSSKIHTMSNNLLEDTMWSSIKSILLIGGYVSMFFVLISMMENYHVLSFIDSFIKNLIPFVNIDSQILRSISSGFFEITRGCLTASQSGISMRTAGIITTFIISFGGLCTHMQALTFLKKFDMSIPFYFMSKISQAALSTIIAVPLSFLFFT